MKKFQLSYLYLGSCCERTVARAVLSAPLLLYDLPAHQVLEVGVEVPSQQSLAAWYRQQSGQTFSIETDFVHEQGSVNTWLEIITITI